jgi:hypothetical protein
LLELRRGLKESDPQNTYKKYEYAAAIYVAACSRLLMGRSNVDEQLREAEEIEAAVSGADPEQVKFAIFDVDIVALRCFNEETQGSHLRARASCKRALRARERLLESAHDAVGIAGNVSEALSDLAAIELRSSHGAEALDLAKRAVSLLPSPRPWTYEMRCLPWPQPQVGLASAELAASRIEDAAKDAATGRVALESRAAKAPGDLLLQGLVVEAVLVEGDVALARGDTQAAVANFTHARELCVPISVHPSVAVTVRARCAEADAKLARYAADAAEADTLREHARRLLDGLPPGLLHEGWVRALGGNP